MIDGSKVILRNKRMSDARNDYEWQKDPELAWLDAAPPIDYTFDEYQTDYGSELFFPSPTRHSFAVDTLDGKHIGNCVYYNIDESRSEAELGIMIGDRHYWDKGYGADAVRVLLSHFFRFTNLNRIYLKTLVSNNRARKCFEKCSFTSCGHLERDGYKFLLMGLSREQWQEEQRQQQGTD